MTDFIHEPPEEGVNASPAPPEAEEEKLDGRTGQKRVYGYIFILFVVAFCLLLWSFLMNQRSTDQVLSELRGNTGALQSTLDRNVELEQRVEILEKHLEELEAEARALKQANETLEADRAALEQERDALRNELARTLAELDALKAQAEEAGPGEADAQN